MFRSYGPTVESIAGFAPSIGHFTIRFRVLGNVQARAFLVAEYQTLDLTHVQNIMLSSLGEHQSAYVT